MQKIHDKGTLHDCKCICVFLCLLLRDWMVERMWQIFLFSDFIYTRKDAGLQTCKDYVLALYLHITGSVISNKNSSRKAAPPTSA